MPRYWSDVDGAFVECEVVWDGKSALTGSEGWQMRESPYGGGNRSETAGLANLTCPRRNRTHGKPRVVPLTTVQKVQAMAAARKGYSARAIGAQIGATRHQVLRWAAEMGINIQRVRTKNFPANAKPCKHECGFNVRPSDYVKGVRSCRHCLARLKAA